MNTVTTTVPLATYLVRHGDDNVVLGQRLGEYISRAPDLEEDLAIANFALDHIGVAQHLLTYAAAVEGDGRDADALAMLRSEREYTNLLLVEQPHDGFGEVIARQFLFDAYQVPLWEALGTSRDETVAGIAQRAHREAVYHLRHSSGWVIRLGDGTEESHTRMQAGIDAMWRFTGEMFLSDEIDWAIADDGVGVDVASLESTWTATVDDVLEEATLAGPDDPYQATGGRQGMHTEHLGRMLAEMQWLQRAHPGATW